MTLLLAVQFITIAVMFATVGYALGRQHRKHISVLDLDRYIQRNFPDEWKAYRKGVNEGYLQGLRDAQETP